MNPLILFGAGGHAREVAQLVRDINHAQPGTWQLIGFIADPEAVALNPKPLPAPWLGSSQQALAAHPNAQCVVAVGNAQARRSIVGRLLQRHSGLRFATLVHPRAWIAEGVCIGPGGVLFAGVLVNVNVTIGSHASINLACTLSHDCVLGDFVSLSPGVHLPGGVTLGDGVEVGTGACFRPRITVGTEAIIGAGSSVVRHLPAHCTAVGVPARLVSGVTERKPQQ